MSIPAISARPDGQVIVTGSLAFDQIMVFPGNFKDHVLADKLHVINISFLVSEFRQQRGGCAGNIAYTLALLATEARIVATAGNDFGDYGAWLREQGVDTSQVRVDDDIKTASCFITSDHNDNQITGFFPGAMGRASELSLKESLGERAAFVIVAPDDPAAMSRHCREAREAGVPFIFDPSFQVTNMEGDALAAAAEGASILMLNDYEHAVFEEKTGKKGDAIFDLIGMLIVTLGGEGSVIRRPGQEEIRVPVVEISGMVDPTGAGDAFRGGFSAGLLRGYDLDICGRLGSVAAGYAVEQRGTQSHAYTQEDFVERYRKNFGDPPEGFPAGG